MLMAEEMDLRLLLLVVMMEFAWKSAEEKGLM
jgi:hypothetical protein